MTIVEFIAARLDEAEADIDCDPYDARYRDLEFGLADIAAKRALLEHAVYQEKYTCTDCVDDGSVIFSALASMYSDHPDYRSEWRP